MNMGLILAAQGEDVFVAAQKILKTVFNNVSGIITLVAVVMVAICVVGMMASKNVRMVEEFKTWRNRIIASWAIFQLLGAIIKYGENLFSGYQYTA